MSIKVMSYVWEHSKHKGSELLTLLAIADCAHDDGTNAFPSIATLAKKTRMTARNTQMVIRKLTDSTELALKPNAGPHGCHRFAIAMNHSTESTPEKISQELKAPLKPTSEVQNAPLKPASPNPSEILKIPPCPPTGDIPPVKLKRWHNCPPNYEPDQKMRDFHARHCPTVDFEGELASFKDHDFDKPKINPDRTFRNWLRKAAKMQAAHIRKPAKPSNPAQQREDQNVSNAIRLGEILNGSNTDGTVWTPPRPARRGVQQGLNSANPACLLAGPRGPTA